MRTEKGEDSVKRKWIALLCMIALLLPCLPAAGWAETPLYLGIDDTCPPLNKSIEPIYVGGVPYIPYTVFDRNNGGSILEVFASWNQERESVTVYSKSGANLEFDIPSGTAYSSYENQQYSFQAVVKNGMAYLPASKTCHYFGLGSVVLTTDDGKHTLLRIRSGKQIMSDQLFMHSVSSLLEERSGNDGQSSNNNPGNTQQPTTQPEDPVGNGSGIYLGIRVENGQQIDAQINALASQSGMKAIFFFPAEDLAQYEAQLRKLTGNGHRVGLIPKEGSTVQQRNSLEEGQRLLKHILRQQASFVLPGAASEEQRAAWQESGYLLWTANVTVASAGRSDSALYQMAIDRISAKKGKVRLLIDDGMKGGTLNSVLKQCRADGFDLRVLRETDY